MKQRLPLKAERFGFDDFFPWSVEQIVSMAWFKTIFTRTVLKGWMERDEIVLRKFF